jgi:hypothetical protein
MLLRFCYIEYMFDISVNLPQLTERHYIIYAEVKVRTPVIQYINFLRLKFLAIRIFQKKKREYICLTCLHKHNLIGINTSSEFLTTILF